MKSKLMISAMFILISALPVLSQTAQKDHLWTYQGKNKVNTLGLYGEVSGSYSELFSNPAAYFGVKAGLVFNKRWTIGLAAYGLSYDKHFNTLVNDGTYHLEAGYSGAFVEYLQPIGSRLKVGASLFTGSGLTLYKYDKDYAEARPWYDETIDQETFAVFEPGVSLIGRMAGHWWLGVNGSYRSTSPLKLKDTPENFLESFNAGVAIRYGIF
jgi:hypothetical protein